MVSVEFELLMHLFIALLITGVSFVIGVIVLITEACFLSPGTVLLFSYNGFYSQITDRYLYL